MKTEEAAIQSSQLAKHVKSIRQRYTGDTKPLAFSLKANMKLYTKDNAANYDRKLLELLPDHFETKQFSN